MYKKNTLSLDEYNLLTLNMGDLTESECRLNEYINKHFNELPYHGIVDLSQNAMVSKATIGRFLNKIGFTGYAAFRKAGNDSNLLIVFYVQIMPDDFVMQLHRF